MVNSNQSENDFQKERDAISKAFTEDYEYGEKLKQIQECREGLSKIEPVNREDYCEENCQNQVLMSCKYCLLVLRNGNKEAP